MKETIQLPPGLDGRVWLHSPQTLALRMHHHDELELNLVVRGKGRYLLKDQRVDLRQGTLIWLFPKQEHLLIDQSRDMQMWIVVFKEELVSRVIAGAGKKGGESWGTLGEGDPPGSFWRELLRPASQRLAAIYEEVRNHAEQPAIYNTGLAYLLAASWDAHLRAAPMARGADVHPSVERIAHAIHNNPGAANLEDLAGECGLSYSRLSRLFKAQTGVSLVHYRRRQRVESFMALFGKGQRRTVTQAALEAGYGSYPQFHRDFTKVVGVSPAEYRRKVRAEAL